MLPSLRSILIVDIVENHIPHANPVDFYGTTTLWFPPVPVSVEAKLSSVELGHRWAHSPSPNKAPGTSYQDTMKTSVRMLETSGGL